MILVDSGDVHACVLWYVYAPRGNLRKCSQQSYEKAPAFKTFGIDKLALALRLISKLHFLFQPEVTDGTYGVLMWQECDFM